MSETTTAGSDTQLICGEFVTDGKHFVLRLKGTPLSGTGETASQAFEELMRAEASAGPLAQRLKQLSREQEGEQLRVTLVRWLLIALIAFGGIGGAVVAGLAMAPKVLADVAQSSASRVGAALENMSPEAEQKLSRLLQRLDKMLGDERACSPPEVVPAPSSSAAPP